MTIRPRTIRARLILMFLAAVGPLLCFQAYHEVNVYLEAKQAFDNYRRATASVAVRSVADTIERLKTEQMAFAQILAVRNLKTKSLESACRVFDSYIGNETESKFVSLPNTYFPLNKGGIGISKVSDLKPESNGHYSFSLSTDLKFSDGTTGVLIMQTTCSFRNVKLDFAPGYTWTVAAQKDHIDQSATGQYEFIKNVPGTDWQMVILGPAQERWSYLGKQKIWLITSTSVALLGFIILFGMGNKLTRHVKKLEMAAIAMGLGDYGKRVNVRTGDELETLAGAFNSLGLSLIEHEDKLREQTDMLAAMVEAAQVASSTLNMRECAKAISQVICTHLAATGAMVFWKNNQEGGVKALGRFGKHSNASWKRVASHASDSGGYLVISEHNASSKPCESGKDAFLVGIPLTTGSFSLGAIVARFETDLSRDDLKLGSARADVLMAFGIHATAAIKNAEVYSRTEKYSAVLEDWVEHLSSVMHVTNAISPTLNLDETLYALAKAAATVLGADKCAIFLPDRNDCLVAKNIYCANGTLTSDLKINKGEAETGKAFVQKQYVSCSDTSRSDDPLTRKLSEKFEIRSLLGTPLIIEDQAIGVITVYNTEPREFSSQEIRLLTSIGLHTAVIVRNASLYTRESSIAEALQKGLVSETPESCSGLTFASKYIPALDEARIGGDFYEVNELPNGKIGVIIGDVSGKGLRAAIHLATCKYMMKTLIYAHPDDPGLVLSKLNEAINYYYDLSFFVTIFYGVIDPIARTITYSSAGHPPSILISGEGNMHNCLSCEGTPVGSGFDCEYETRTVRASESDVLLLYTDGVTDLMNGSSILGVEGFHSMVFEAGKGSAAQIIEYIIGRIDSDPGLSQRDDIAMLAVSFQSSSVTQSDKFGGSDERQYCLPILSA